MLPPFLFSLFVKDLSYDALWATTAKLDETSEEYRTGIEALRSRATSSTSLVLVEVDEDIDEDASKASGDTNKAKGEPLDWFEQERYDTERATSAVLIEVNADIDRVIDEIKESNDSILSTIGGWLGGMFEPLIEVALPTAELILSTLADLAADFSIIFWKRFSEAL
ncbi:unnamed protein product [marine sediment metagenome]|uniref:Uncharacterized protein n=1 Tax=marine sediment metagenome TaxID=412755 RepID=X1UA80_9ZZZZ